MFQSGISQRASEPKNIVICSDGTGNHDIQARGTNVFKLYEAVDIHGDSAKAGRPRQVAIYDNGVGTSGPLPVRAFCSAVGFGFSANVQHLYRSLLEVYEEGDHIYLFGFSRGAYTVRALAGLISFSLAKDMKEPRPTDLVPHVRKRWTEYTKCATSSKDAAETESTAPPLVRFLGVWDTVGAVGFPLVDLTRPHYRLIRWAFWWVPWFGDNRPCQTVERACQALALDDQRATFRPELWNEEKERDRAPRIKQVWFAGVHANVGGGYPRQGISLVALDWMMREAEDAGLHFIPSDRTSIRAHCDVHDRLYDSRAGFGAYYRWKPRRVVALSREQNISEYPMVHESALQRVARGTEGYAPINVPLPCKVVYTNAPGSGTPIHTKDFDPKWPVEKFSLPEDAQPKFGEKVRTFFADYCMLQLGLGLMAGVFVHQMLQRSDHEILAQIIPAAVVVVAIVGVTALRVVWFALDAALRWIPPYENFRKADDRLEKQSEYHCLTEALGDTIAAGQRSYRLFVTSSLFAVVAGIVSASSHAARLDLGHSLFAAAILAVMAYLAWAAGASVDKRLAKATSAFWNKERRDQIRMELFPELAPNLAGRADGLTSQRQLIADNQRTVSTGAVASSEVTATEARAE